MNAALRFPVNPRGGTCDTNPGWMNDQRLFWLGKLSTGAGAGPTQAPGSLAPTGGNAPAAGGSSSADSQTTPFTVSSSDGTPRLIVPRQPTRSALTIQNNGIANIFVFFGPQAQNPDNTALALTIAGGASYNPRVNVPVDEIYIGTTGVSVPGVVVVGTSS